MIYLNVSFLSSLFSVCPTYSVFFPTSVFGTFCVIFFFCFVAPLVFLVLYYCPVLLVFTLDISKGVGFVCLLCPVFSGWFIGEAEWHRERIERERCCFCGSVPQMLTVARSGHSRSPKQRIPCSSPTQVARAQILEPRAALPRESAGSQIKRGVARTYSGSLMWNAGIPSSILTHCTLTPAPN